MSAAVLAYFARPWSCNLVLSRFTPGDPVPYARFDYHGVGVMSAWAMALLFAAPMLWLASKIFLNPAATLSAFGRARDSRSTILSILASLALGAPMHSQLAYLIGLPIGVTMPVLISSLAWLSVVEVGRTAVVRGDFLDERSIRLVVAMALLITVPKLAFIAFAAM